MTVIAEHEIEHLLGRAPIAFPLESFASKRILITGAAGSIGSEVCRLLAHRNPESIIALDFAETPLFYLQLEIKRRCFHPVLADVGDTETMKEVFARFRPHIVIHTAAYKHVPLMEDHVFAAVRNNVLATVNLVRIAAEFNVERFVLLSTDKAVRPVSIVGLTKRIAELFVTGFDAPGSHLCSRFGNVLGSNGSVVPVFLKQLERGVPLTVTHPEMRRFLITASEAAQFVLFVAGSENRTGVIAFDPGQQVSILELAHTLIRLRASGARVEVTGIRPGEKLSEELFGADEIVTATNHPNVFVCKPEKPMMPDIAQIESACISRDEHALRCALQQYAS